MKKESGFIDESILQDAIDTFGASKQLTKLREECQELALAITQYERSQDLDKLKAVVDEAADVKIVLAQFEKMIPGNILNNRVDFKMKRLQEKIKNKDY